MLKVSEEGFNEMEDMETFQDVKSIIELMNDNLRTWRQEAGIFNPDYPLFDPVAAASGAPAAVPE